MSTLATILEIQRMSTEDGPGIRSTVFFKGCSLACSWCHNPESITKARQILWQEWRCIGCRSCVTACPQGARALSETGMVLDKTRCRDCGRCLDACPSLALERQGRRLTLPEVLDELLHDRAFFEESGGGVTLSGGEPVLQHRFAAALLDALEREGIHRALDTCGQAPRGPLLDLARRADLVLFDLKIADDDEHRRATGKGIKRIRENLLALAEQMRKEEGPGELWIRTPCIPGATTSRENILAIGAWIAAELDGLVSRWDLCAFNNLCRDQYSRLGHEWRFADTPLLTVGELDALEEIARESGVTPEIVHTSGPTQVERSSRKEMPTVDLRVGGCR